MTWCTRTHSLASPSRLSTTHSGDPRLQVLLDLAIVLTELVLSSFYPTPELAPHVVHVAEEVRRAPAAAPPGLLACARAAA